MIRIHPEAHAEAVEAQLHYLAESPEVAQRFRVALSDGYASAGATPLRWPQDEDGFRRYKLIGFPYIIFYEPLDNGILVHAVAHGARKPGYWHNRAK